MGTMLASTRTRLIHAALRRARRTTDAPPEGGGELNIVPLLDIVVNLMLFLLATVTVAMAVAEVEAELPTSCATGRCSGPPGLDLAVSITDRGIAVTTSSGGLAPGCAEVVRAAPLTVPRRRDGHDMAALRACLERVSASRPDERTATLTADPDVPYEHVIAVMDALRGSPEAPLFPRVRLSAGLR